MDDNRSLRLWFQIFLTACVYLIYVWISGLGGVLFKVRVEHLGVKIVGLFAIPLIGFVLPQVIDFASAATTFLIYGGGYSTPSYENQFYQDGTGPLGWSRKEDGMRQYPPTGKSF